MMLSIAVTSRVTIHRRIVRVQIKGLDITCCAAKRSTSGRRITVRVKVLGAEMCKCS